MQTSKRKFIKSLALIGFLPFQKDENFWDNTSKTPDYSKEFKEDWDLIRTHYELKKEYINLENGYFNMMSQPVLNAYLNDIRMVNREASYYMRTVQFENKAKTRDRLAKLIGCEPEELIITRNTTESLDTIISGYDWKAGDEAIMAEQDYGSMLDMFRQQAERYGIKNTIVSLPIDPKSDEEIISLYEKAITPKTRLIMVCHMVNISGQILPIKKICQMAHQKGIEVMVDGAHAIAQLDFKISDLGCDYYGSSLHKWLGSPMGAGILYINKSKIKKLWPIYADYGFENNHIEKLNHTGTHPVATDIAINHSIDYHQWISVEKKELRLRFLKNYWTEKVRGKKGIILNTPSDPQRSAAIANVGIEGINPSDLAKILLDQYRIWTVAIDRSNIKGVRVTPNLYTTTQELDEFVNALLKIAKA
jgi:selenocysteine lyase/cysteine desulfurase